MNKDSKNKSNYFSIGEMYCGPGGLGLGATLSKFTKDSTTWGYKHIWATDYDKDSCETYKNNVVPNEPDCQIICSDIHDLDINELPYVDGFMYGFPCNDFSNVGETEGLDGKFGGLYKYGIEYINKNNPKFIIAENVTGISSANSGRAFEKILSELENAGTYGYELTNYLYKFENYGIPQARHRYIIVGFRSDLGLKFMVPKESNISISSKHAIENPPIPSNSTNHELSKQSSVVTKRLKYIKPGENAWSANIPKNLRLNVNGAKLSMIYKRLDPNKPSYTITGSGGGGTHVYHWEENRALTNRERARLQTFPDNFHFYGGKGSVRKQIGMAIPVKGAEIILTAVLKMLLGIEYPHIEGVNNLQSKLF